MASGSWSLRLLLVVVVVGACSDSVLAQATPAAAKSGGPPSFCTSFNDVTTAAGFPVTLKIAGGSPDSFDCVY